MNNKKSTTYWNKLQAVFEEALTIEKPLRLQFVEKAVDNDADAIKEIMLLLQGDSAAESLFQNLTSDAVDIFNEFNLLGKQIGKYKILDRIGTGGMGDIYLAMDSTLNRNVVLKFLSPNFSRVKEHRQRFLREAKLAASLNHSNIITIHEIGEFQQQPFIVMEYIDGCTLRDVLNNHETTIHDQIAILIQTCEGLQAAHQIGMLHRDMKPSNIIIAQNNNVRILDFGLAKIIDETQITKAGITPGTANYMSPEQGKGLPLDNRSDLFSLGIILYEIITGTTPFKSDSIPSTIYSIVHNAPPPLDKFIKEPTSQINTLILKALHKDRDKRYQTAQDFKSALIELKDIISAPTLNSFSDETENNALAVLYLKNLGATKDEFLAYGITEDLIIDISCNCSVRVIPMRTIIKHKNSDEDTNIIANTLNVNLLLDGSIHRYDNKIKISIQLLETKSNKNLWSKRWDENFDNLTSIKREITENINRVYNKSQNIDIVKIINNKKIINADAFENYLRGKYSFEHRNNKSDVTLSISLFNKALQEDPNLLAAKIGIAEIKIYDGLFEEAKIDLNAILKETARQKSQKDKASTLKLLSLVYDRSSELNNAQKYALRAVECYNQLGDLGGEADSLGFLIAINQKRAEYKLVLKNFERVLEISYQLKDSENISHALKNIGVTHARIGEYEKALKAYNEALETVKKHNYFSLEAAILSNIGNIFFFQNNLTIALEYYRKSLNIGKQLSDITICARQKLNISLIYLRQSKYEDGIKLLNKTANEFKDIGDRSGYAIAISNVSQAYIAIGKFELSINAAEESLHIARKVNQPIPESNSLIQLGVSYYYQENYDKAIELLHEALKISHKAKFNRNIAQCELMLAFTYFSMNEFEKCRKHITIALSISEEIGHTSISVTASGILGALMIIDGLFHSGIKQMLSVIKKLSEMKEYEKEIEINIIYCKMLLLHGTDDEMKKQGLQELQELHKKSIDINFLMGKILADRLLEYKKNFIR